jgi:glycosidase
VGKIGRLVTKLLKTGGVPGGGAGRGAPLLFLALPGLLAAAPAIPQAGASADHGRPGEAVLHVPSPEWRDQVLYFVVTDRFANGDPSNDDQHAGEFDPADRAKYNGGDLRGVVQHLDYIRGLGATGVWVTPPVLNRWWDPRARHGGYHGYWAKDFSKLDPHYGVLADYQDLSRQLHRRGMVLVQDIVLNHTADYFRYDGGWDPADPARHFVREKDSTGDKGPTQAPFDENDATDGSQRKDAIYHWTPDVVDYRDPKQVTDYQMAGLDDLNSENPVVRRALRKSYDQWIERVGVDGFRIDTAFYVPRDALADFLYSEDAQAPGVMYAAARTGREFFHVFGEGFAIDKPYEATQAQRVETLMQGEGGRPLLPGAINFPLYGALNDVFARGAPSAVLGQRIESMMRVHERPELMPTFLDNHDVDRFLAGGNEGGLSQGLLAIFTLPGIPTIYYGTEQEFGVQRAAMFANGSDSGGQDHFDTQSPMYRLIAALSALRREHRVLSRGRPTVLASSRAAAGVLAYRMDAGDDALLVLFNSADSPALLDNLDLDLRPGARLPLLFSLDVGVGDAVAAADGRVSMALPARSGRVYQLPKARADEGAVQGSAITMAPLANAKVDGDFEVEGRAPVNATLQLVADGDLARAQRVVADAKGAWHARVDSSAMIDPAIEHRLVAWSPDKGAVSAPVQFQVSPRWRLAADVEDPAGDDVGATDGYAYPTDPSWAMRPLDIRHVRVETAGGAMRVSVRMGSISTAWNPPNGFDHVAFNLFIELPGEGEGATVMPMQHGDVPEGMHWHRRLRVHGWTNALFAASGATADADGTPVTPAAGLAVDSAANTVSFTVAASALGNRKDLSGARIYLNTWDYDGGYRPLDPKPAGAHFGGGRPGEATPLWMDATGVIELPSR